MKKNLLPLLFLAGFTFNANSVWINSVTVSPSNPSDLQNVKVIVGSTLAYSPCSLVSSLDLIPNDTVYIYAYYQTGMLNTLCNAADTFDIGLVPCNVRGLSVTVFESGGTSASATYTQSFSVNCGSVGIESQHSKNIFSLHPNPAGEKIRMQMKVRVTSPVKIKILNILGETVLSSIEFHPGSVSENSFDVSELSKGLYLFSLETVSGTFVKKFVVE